MYIRLD